MMTIVEGLFGMFGDFGWIQHDDDDNNNDCTWLEY